MVFYTCSCVLILSEFAEIHILAVGCISYFGRSVLVKDNYIWREVDVKFENCFISLRPHDGRKERSVNEARLPRL